MESIAKETVTANLEQEMRKSYLDYAMSVIVGRALPDVRDGLKPVHRRILYAMAELGNDWNKPYKKSARVAGDVMGKYHPHGESAIYDSIVRMAQDFSMRNPLIDGQGNFGSIDGDSAAAMRYTEVRLSKLAHELLADIDKETVDFIPNYDETELQPTVLPTRLPNLLMNGSDGIAVGMATKIPPHNLSEIIEACLALIDDDSLSVQDLMEYIPGPDFPTAGIINGRAGIIKAYQTGRGSIRIRAKAEFEASKDSKKVSIIVTEIPFQIIKARLIEQIADLVREKKLEGISDMRDESDKSGMRIVIELKQDAIPDVVLNNLYSQTRLQISYGINLVGLENNQPNLFDLKALLNNFLRHRREVVTRRLIYELRKARERAHLLEGFTVALSNIDRLIDIIRAAPNRPEAKSTLRAEFWDPKLAIELRGSIEVDDLEQGASSDFGIFDQGYKLSEAQVDAILDLRLHRLTGLEQEKVFDEFRSVLQEIAKNVEILATPSLLEDVIKKELIEARDEYAKNDVRRTRIIEAEEDYTDEDLIAREDMIVTISRAGYAKRQPASDYEAQHRGGRGKTATTHKDDDFVSRMFIANTHNTLLCFTNFGKLFWIKVYKLPQASRTARGRPLVNLLKLSEGEKVTVVLPIEGFDEGRYVVMSTRKGKIKKCKLSAFSNPRSNGIWAINLNDDDELFNVGLTEGNYDILLFNSAGRAVRFCESNIRSMGRMAGGVRGIKLSKEETVISMILVPPDIEEDATALLVSSDGLGKRTFVKEFPLKGRNTKGVVILPKKRRDGKITIVDALLVTETDEVMLITNGGTLIRTRACSVSRLSRSAGGVRLIRLGEGQELAAVARIVESDEEQGEIEEQATSTEELE